ncbi:hypothetical protein RGQ29_031974 [Quercus rubra]|uniref:SHSP domain-containing protein n=1 Tax=Quercus rubra TaxID=3512 RepID=A0AAN7DT30_QUERU|nr:hypothetical protein RGQ29_031974 [Quercus rubra]
MYTSRLHDRDIDSLFDRFLSQYGDINSAVSRNSNITNSRLSPAIDAHENDKEYVVVAEIPGLKKEELDISVNEGVLTISGERKRSSEFKDGASLVRERQYGKFSRTIKMPTPISADKIKAGYENGVLEVKLPKAESQQKKKIAIA